MRIIRNVVPLLALVAMVGCEKEDTGTNKQLYYAQRANVRMDIKQKDRQAKTDVGIVGDSAAVKKLARWGYSIFARVTERGPQPVVGVVTELQLCSDNYASFSRDTASCIFIFAFTSVFDYTTYKNFWDGSPVVGVPGTERPGWLLTMETPVFIGYYDTVEQCYKDPLPESYLDTNTGYWVYPVNETENARIDTMGYIPQSIMDANYPRLQQLYDEERYSEMIEVMQNGYTIYTCTGEEYRELVRLGLN